MNHYRSLAHKVYYDYISGRDVTDEYQDINAHLKILTEMKARYETIRDRAETVNELLEVERQIINVQNQIDSLKGRQVYLEQTAALAKVTVHLSTDELALPYTPSEGFRPELVYRQAVRSVLGTLIKLANASIWIVVYSIIWGPIFLALMYYQRRKQPTPHQPPRQPIQE